MNTNGVTLDESLNIFAKSKVGGSINSYPNYSLTKSITAGTILSNLIDLRIINLWKGL